MLAISGLHERFLFLCIYFFCLCAAVFSSVNMPCICSMFIRLLPWWLRGESVCLQCGRPRFNPWVRKTSWRKEWQPTPVFLPPPPKKGAQRNIRASLVAQMVKRLTAMRKTRVPSLGWEDPLEKEMVTHSSTLAWKIPRTEEPGRLQSMGSQRVGHD